MLSEGVYLIISMCVLTPSLQDDNSVLLSPSTVTVVEGEQATFTCSVSGGVWRLYSRFIIQATDNKELTGALDDTQDTCKLDGICNSSVYRCICKRNNTYEVTSMNTSRDMHGELWKCSIPDSSFYKDSNNSTLHVNVPVNKVTINGSEHETLEVMENRIIQLQCRTSPSRPLANMSWFLSNVILHGFYENVYSSLQDSINVTISDITLTTKRTMNGQEIRCNAVNIINYPQATETLHLNVTYPPVIERLQDLHVIEGDHVTMRCIVNGSTTMVQWKSNKHNVLDAVLTIPNVSRTVVSTYTCRVNYTMQPSCQDEVKGSTDESLHLNVLYPPSVDIPLEYRTITKLEGMMLRYNCTVVLGNPSTTNVTWGRSVDSSIWRTSELLIGNVSRHHASVYTCYATNVMTRTNGTTEIGQGSGNFTLIIQFKADVTNFYIQAFEQNTRVVVNENIPLIFVCQLESEPTADVRIIHDTGAVVNSSKSNELFYYTTSSCTGRSEHYSCHGNNTFNKQPSNRQIALSVRCEPRQDNKANIQFHEASAINHTVTFSYTALAYPHPTFIWYRHGAFIDSNDPRTIISSSNLQTNLTIIHIEKNDFGRYVVNAINDVGSYNDTFYLKPQGAPEVPTSFKQINSTTTESSITLAWTPEFNNGFEQTFTILYRIQPDGTWLSVDVKDTGAQNISHNMTGLTPSTTYHVILFAFNDLGRSRSNVTLSCRTNIAPRQTMASTSQDVTGIVVGTICCVIVLCGILLSVIIYRRRFANTSKSTTTEPTISTLPVTYENLKIDTVLNEPTENLNERSSGSQQSVTNIDHTYEGLSARSEGKEKEYSSLIVDNKTDAKVVYENLKI